MDCSLKVCKIIAKKTTIGTVFRTQLILAQKLSENLIITVLLYLVDCNEVWGDIENVNYTSITFTK